MTITEAAEKVLREVGHPMHSMEIVEYAKRKRWIAPKGKTPHHSLQAALYRHMQLHGTDSLFVKVGGVRRLRKYALRVWRRRHDPPEVTK